MNTPSIYSAPLKQRSIEDVKIFADGLDHPECIAIHPNGTVWAGGEAGQVYCISADGKQIIEAANTGGFVLGLAFSPGAKWLAICDLKKNCIWKFDLETDHLSIFATEVESQPIRIPNYPVFDKEGNLYVSDSGAFRQVNGKIYKFDPSGKGIIWHNGPFNFANGLALDPGQNNLYIVCSFLPGIEKVSILDDGTAGERSVLVHMPQTCPDGIALDTHGNIFISCYAPNTIFQLNSDGSLSTLLHDWESHTICNPTNIAFGGKDGNTLFIANLGRWHISTLTL